MNVPQKPETTTPVRRWRFLLLTAAAAVAGAVVTVAATAVSVTATVVETTVDVAAAGVDAVVGEDEEEQAEE